MLIQGYVSFGSFPDVRGSHQPTKHYKAGKLKKQLKKTFVCTSKQKFQEIIVFFLDCILIEMKMLLWANGMTRFDHIRKEDNRDRGCTHREKIARDASPMVWSGNWR